MIYCPKCRNEIDGDSTFCKYCGKEIGVVLRDEIPTFPYNESYGFWKVTTEGDVEGRITKNLGVYEGHIDEIAKALSPASYYGLRFTAVPPPKEFSMKGKSRKSVAVSFDINSNTWNLSGDQLVKAFSKILKDRPVKVKEGGGYASVTLVFDS